VGFSVPTVFYIAPKTTHITPAKAYKPSWRTCKGTLTLDCVKLFHNWQELTQCDFFWTAKVVKGMGKKEAPLQ
jgi:hypothetical protein